jgi:hypothetical protein
MAMQRVVKMEVSALRGGKMKFDELDTRLRVLRGWMAETFPGSPKKSTPLRLHMMWCSEITWLRLSST